MLSAKSVHEKRELNVLAEIKLRDEVREAAHQAAEIATKRAIIVTKAQERAGLPK